MTFSHCVSRTPVWASHHALYAALPSSTKHVELFRRNLWLPSCYSSSTDLPIFHANEAITGRDDAEGTRALRHGMTHAPVYFTLALRLTRPTPPLTGTRERKYEAWEFIVCNWWAGFHCAQLAARATRNADDQRLSAMGNLSNRFANTLIIILPSFWGRLRHMSSTCITRTTPIQWTPVDRRKPQTLFMGVRGLRKTGREAEGFTRSLILFLTRISQEASLHRSRKTSSDFCFGGFATYCGFVRDEHTRRWREMNSGSAESYRAV